MGRDPVGAEATNLGPGARQDIYQIVADRVNTAIAQELEGVEVSDGARAWAGNVARKTVKRGVMTTPYGVTPRGIASQLKAEGFTRGLEGDELANANYLKDRMVDAIDSTVVKGKEIMKWMQKCADTLGKHNQGVTWTTPMGMKIHQQYCHPRASQVTTLMGKMTLSVTPEANAKMNMRKQVHAVAPNIIHSFDAAHMMAVALEVPEDTSLAMVHDSFGCHACDVDHLLEVTKRTFVTIYSEDWFASLRADFMFFSNDVELPEPPVMGAFNIEDVLKSNYFFA